MEVNKVGTRGILFSFYDLGIPTNVYVIIGCHYAYVIDTYLGPDSMKQVNDYIEREYGKKEPIIINTHNHWDHVWGNCLYPTNIIIAHKLCKELMERDGLDALNKEREYIRGDVKLTYPNVLITDQIIFEEDGVLIYYTPGHTDDCISVVDAVDKVLFAGDNIERPIPYITSVKLNEYVKTLEKYVELDVKVVIGGHTSCEGKQLIRDNLEYIKKFNKKDTREYEVGKYATYHKSNTDWFLMNSNI